MQHPPHQFLICFMSPNKWASLRNILCLKRSRRWHRQGKKQTLSIAKANPAECAVQSRPIRSSGKTPNQNTPWVLPPLVTVYIRGPIKGYILPEGSKDPNNRVLGPKYYTVNVTGALKAYYLGPWTLRAPNKNAPIVTWAIPAPEKHRKTIQAHSGTLLLAFCREPPGACQECTCQGHTLRHPGLGQ